MTFHLWEVAVQQWTPVDDQRVAELMELVRRGCESYLDLLATGRVDADADAAMRSLVGVNVHHIAEHEAAAQARFADLVVVMADRARALPGPAGAPTIGASDTLSAPGEVCYRPAATTGTASFLEFDRGHGDRLRIAGDEQPVESSSVVLCQVPVDDPRGGGWIVSSERVDQPATDSPRWQVWARRTDTGRAEPVTAPDGHAINARAVATADGRLHVVYQKVNTDARFEIAYRSRGNHGWDDEQVLAGGRHSCWDPVIATDGAELAVVYSAVSDGRFRLNLVRGNGSRWSEPVPVPLDADGHALHPDVLFDAAGGVLMATDVLHADNLATSGRTALVPTAELDGQASFQPLPSYSLDTRIAVVRADQDGFTRVTGPMVCERTEGGYPRIAVDDAGRLWLGYRTLRQLPFRNYLSMVAVRTHDGNGFSEPVLVPGSEAAVSEFALVAEDDGVAVVCVGDSFPDDFRAMLRQDPLSREEPPIEPGVVRREHLALPKIGRISTGSHLGGGVIRRIRLTSPAPRRGAVLEPIADAQQRVSTSRPDPAGWPPVPGTELLWGDMHRHSNISRCGAGLDIGTTDHYRFAEDLMGYDFWLLTDHAEGTSDLSWHAIRAQANAAYRPGRHVAMLGYEWTSFVEGHLNVIFAGDDGPMLSSADEATEKPDGLWQALEGVAALTIPHHPSSLCYFTNWSWRHERLRLVELFQAATGSYEDEWCARQYHDAVIDDSTAVAGLRAGQQVGFVASTDHRAGSAYVGVYATARDRAAVHQALWDRRCFAATRRGIVPRLRIGGAEMGEQVAWSDSLDLEFGGSGAGELALLQLIRDGEVVADSRSGDGHHLDIRISTARGGPRELSGLLQVQGDARLVVPEFCAPIIADVDERQIRWQATLPERYSGHPLAPGVFTFSVSVDGDDDAELELTMGALRLAVTLGELRTGPVRAELDGAELAVRRGVGSLTGLGTDTWLGAADKDLLRPGSWYYTRVFQTDGEMAWSSPIWLTE